MLGGLAGVLAALLPAAWGLEERFGLPLLYELRGERAPPAGVLVVGMDEASAEHFGLGSVHDKWPRAIHADLVNAAAGANAAVIVFDVFFRDPRDPHTPALAAALRRAGNVALFSYTDADRSRHPGRGLTRTRLVPPAPDLAAAAIATAPFVLPKTPWGVLYYWAFQPRLGDAPALPVVAWHRFMLQHHPTLAPALARHCLAGNGGAGSVPCRGGWDEALHCRVGALHRRLATGGACLEGVGGEPGLDGPAVALARVHRDPARRYLNFYGPAGTIPVISYRQALAELRSLSPAALAARYGGKALFVGHAEVARWEQRDAFVTVYSDPVRGVDLPGVEIAATAFANLVDGSTLAPAPPLAMALLLGAMGLVLGAAARGLGARLSVPLVVVTGAVYLLAAGWLFATRHLWLPVAVPLAALLPLLLAAGLLWRYYDVARERRAVVAAAGYYLPESVVRSLATRQHHPGGDRWVTRGVCLATDVGGYTGLAEGLDSAALGRLMGDYYAEVFAPVRQYRGLVSDIKGDAMMAIWTAGEAGEDPRPAAARAAVEIQTRVDAFNRRGPHRLPTRIGLHYGEILLGGVGAGHHYEYRPVGDTVNTASRIEGANKVLGTRVLASEAVAQALAGAVPCRDLGRFLLRGKTRPLGLVELLPERDAPCRECIESFDSALARVREGRMRAALAAFAKTARRHHDGPARFYARHLAALAEGGGLETWDGVVRLP